MGDYLYKQSLYDCIFVPLTDVEDPSIQFSEVGQILTPRARLWFVCHTNATTAHSGELVLENLTKLLPVDLAGLVVILV